LGFLIGGAAGAAEPERSPVDEQILKQAGVGTDDMSLLNFFRQRTPNDAEIRALVRKLGDDDFQTREKASRELTNLGPPAIPYLREALKTGDPEVVRRAEECLRNIGTGTSPALIAAAARLLAGRKPAGATEVLLAYLPKVEGASTEEEVLRALRVLALRDGKPDPVLMTALADLSPGKRAAAAVALAHSGAKDAWPAIHRLLKDPEVTVRLQVGLALTTLKEKDAVPVLIDLLPQLTYAQLGPVEDVLYRLAEDKAPDLAAGSDPETRRKYRDAWARWWKDEGDKLDLARLDQAARFLGYTMVVLLDAGRIMEVDADNKLRWQIENLNYPLDAQLLPGDRVLVAEYKGNCVTERSRKGEILWKKDLEGPLMAQRLPGGNTLIATRFQLLEVDQSGKQVFAYMRSQGDQIMKAQKQPARGEIGLITNGGPNTSLFVRLNAEGKEVSSFPVGVRTSGGRVEMLPNGHVVMPLKDENKVVEYDLQGRVVWQAAFPDPVAAIRLRNGHTLITAYQSQRAVEVDQTGKEVWQYKADQRLTRAWRR
jgi:hypothetical protein